jgi:benzoate 4-monooxygenase
LDELELHYRYGRIVRVGPNWLSFSNLSDFEAIYGFNHHIEKGEFYDFGRDRARGIYNIFTAHTENQHREKRKKVFSPALTVAKVATYGDVVHRHGSNLVSRLESLRRRSAEGEDGNGNDSDNGQAVNIAQTVHRYTIDTLLEVIYGPIVCPVPFTDIPAASGFPETIQSAGKMAWTASLLPTLGWLMSTPPMMAWTRRVMLNAEGQPTNISAVAVASATLIYSQRERISQCQQSSILKHWTDLPSDDSRKMSPPELWNEAFNLTLAGHGSSAGALTALLYRLGLGAGKSWQGKIRTEIKAAGHVMSIPLASAFPILFDCIPAHHQSWCRNCHSKLTYSSSGRNCCVC